ncbi:MAG: hypothetical protein NT067_07560 [Candidatus Diapherotrites archaeon]|nr:hypothetical protein [Candidatus Diapherotrites archaeon]
MDVSSFFDRKKALFVAIFAVLAFVSAGINFSSLLGTQNQSFTYFQFFAPATGFFLGPLAGAISVLAAQAAALLAGGDFSLFNIARLAPMFLAAYYFGAKNKKFVALIPLACMALFIAHPVGREAWFYSLFWLIPLAATLFKENLFLKSLGATFTAHAIGATAFIYLLPSTPALWAMLVPVTAVERLLFACGISVSFIAFNYALSWIDARVPLKAVRLDPKYTVKFNAS